MDGSSKRPSAGWIVAIILTILLVGGTSYAAGAQLVKSADEPGRHPYQASISCQIPDTQSSSSASVQVPSNKRVVIDYVSAFGHMPPGEKLVAVDLISTADASTLSHALTPVFTGAAHNSDNYFAVSQPTTLFADPGSTLATNCIRDSITGVGLVGLVVSGHLLSP